MLLRKQLIAFCDKEYRRQGLICPASYLHFLDIYFQHFIEEDFNVEQCDYLYQLSKQHYEHIQEYVTGKTEIFLERIVVQKEYQKTLIRIFINYPEKPFLIESIRSLLVNLEGSIVYSSIMANYAVEKTARKVVITPEEVGSTFVAIDFEPSAEISLPKLKSKINETIKNIDKVVKDWRRMQDQLRNVVAFWRDTSTDIVPEEIMNEYTAFLEWLLGNFTFIGYHGYSVRNGKMTLLKEEYGLPVVQGSNKFKICVDQFPKQLNGEQYPLLMITKTPDISQIHRNTHKDLLVLRVYDKKNALSQEHYFSGLLTSAAYLSDPTKIPLIALKCQEAMTSFGVRSRYALRRMGFILKEMPKEELFQIDVSMLAQVAYRVLMLQEKEMVRLFLRRDICQEFYTATVYVPRDIFKTKLRLKIQDYLKQVLCADSVEYSPFFTESILTRLYFIFRCAPGTKPQVDEKEMQAELEKICKSWDDELRISLSDLKGQKEGLALSRRYINQLTEQYKNTYTAEDVARDINYLEQLDEENVIKLNIDDEKKNDESFISLKLYSFLPHTNVPLTKVFPILMNMGLGIQNQSHFIETIDGKDYQISEYLCSHQFKSLVPLEAVKDELINLFQGILQHTYLDDEYNAIVMVCGLSIKEVAVLRAMCLYLHQIHFPLSMQRCAKFFMTYPGFSQVFIKAFNVRFQPKIAKREFLYKKLYKEAKSFTEEVKTSDDERIVLALLNLLEAIVRTNYCVPDREALVLKIRSKTVLNIPNPAPEFEFFVHSARVMGVHLRFNKTARGGIRNSDRVDDVRHEVFELAKTQRLKNTLIIPDGAKGGFVCSRLFTEEPIDRKVEVLECYQSFISSMLMLVDNVQGSKYVLHPSVVSYDDPDPYFVVAADKGTATFSPYANEISLSQKYWLGDAFASGGKHGYDHKKMGITAKGAWESLMWHFGSMGKNVYKDEFTVSGIGDMSGDVFGNGMLLSDKILLVAAFNHKHIFIDPAPQAKKSFKERLRLFNLPGSGWDDYNETLISAGGGVFNRTDKYINMTPEMRALFNSTKQRIDPNDLIKEILKAPVDVIWNGGIGVYVKSAEETHFSVMDFFNDCCRVDACDMRAKVFIEGGNNGLTQKARVDFARAGGSINTDFIDNSAGVNTSDVEVNFKILFQLIVSKNMITTAQRNQILARLSSDVATQVLHNNFLQNIQINMAMIESRISPDSYIRFVDYLEGINLLNRRIEKIPTKKELIARKKELDVFSRPEISVLLSYSKISLYSVIQELPILQNSIVLPYLESYFPKYLQKKYLNVIHQHSLRTQIIATGVTNQLIGHAGILFISQLSDECNAHLEEIVSAYVVSCNVLGINDVFEQVYSLSSKMPQETFLYILGSLRRTLYRSSRWLIRFTDITNFQEVLDAFKGLDNEIEVVPFLSKKYIHRMAKIEAQIEEAGVSQSVAKHICNMRYAYQLFALKSVAIDTGYSLQVVKTVYYQVAQTLKFHKMRERLNTIDTNGRWEAIQKSTIEDDCGRMLEKLTKVVLLETKNRQVNTALALELWVKQNELKYFEIKRALTEINDLRKLDLSVFVIILARIVSTIDNS